MRTRRLHLFASRDGRRFADVFRRTADLVPQTSIVMIPAGIAPGDAVVFNLRAT